MQIASIMEKDGHKRYIEKIFSFQFKKGRFSHEQLETLKI